MYALAAGIGLVSLPCQVTNRAQFTIAIADSRQLAGLLTAWTYVVLLARLVGNLTLGPGLATMDDAFRGTRRLFAPMITSVSLAGSIVVAALTVGLRLFRPQPELPKRLPQPEVELIKINHEDDADPERISFLSRG